ncbi:WD40/YVTN/BNR-like repeat-containing protein [Sorangium sp. So ce1182]|uniref:WD40/YVTN/BNR-like repeat-containing protein n=1 Tax=Sorangium sp. So ce1182 TaxID=3133334 RepID=UPI003F5EEEBB
MTIERQRRSGNLGLVSAAISMLAWALLTGCSDGSSADAETSTSTSGAHAGGGGSAGSGSGEGGAGADHPFDDPGTCSDSERNQREDDVDCGGPCAPCVFWQRVAPSGAVDLFLTRQGTLLGSNEYDWLTRLEQLDGAWQRVLVDGENVTVKPLANGSSGEIYGVGEGLARSDDDGLTWQVINPEFSPGFLKVIDDALYAGLGNDLYRSTDAGVSWELVAGGLGGGDLVRLEVNADGIWFLVSYKLVMRSLDRGATWFEVAYTEGDTAAGLVELSDGVVLVGRGATPPLSSADRGDSWKHAEADDVSARVLAANSTDLLFSGGTGVDMSEDGGLTWTERGDGELFGFRSMVMLPDDRLVVLDNNDQVFVSRPTTFWGKHEHRGEPLPASCTDGAQGPGEQGADCGGSCPACPTWRRLAEVNLTNVQWVAATPDGTLFFDDQEGRYRSTDAGASWALAELDGEPLPFISTLIQMGDGTMLATSGVGLYRSSDRGGSWSVVDAALNVGAIALHPDGRLYSFRQGFSSDGGESWERVSEESRDITGVVFTDNGDLYAHGSRSLVRSLDGGRTFEPLDGLPLDNDEAYVKLAAAPNGHLFLGSYKGIFRSTDRGVSFTGVTDAAWNVLVDSKGNVFAFGEGISMSRDDGDTWESRLLGVNVAPRAVALADDRIYLNTALGHYLSTTTTAW